MRNFSGVKGTGLTLGLAAQVRTIPGREHRASRPSLLCLTPRQHCRPSAAKRKNFVTQASPGRPEPVPDDSGKKKGVKMTASKISKGLLLGLALLLATSVFAANKGSLQVSDPVTVNGKQ